MLKPRLRSFATVLILSVAVAGCSSSDTTSSTEAPSISPTSLAVADDVGPSEPDAEASNEIETSPIADMLGLPGITLLTPESGGGARPELVWGLVDQASFYNVVLLDPSGRGYWGWEGTSTAVHVGGEPVIKEGLSGPSVIDGMTWQVAAYDADQNLVALSHRQPIAP